MAKMNTRYFVFGSLTAEYIDRIQEYPAAKSFLGAGDNIQLREILDQSISVFQSTARGCSGLGKEIGTVASVKVRTSSVIRMSPYVIFTQSLGGGTPLSDHHPGSVRCFRTVPSVVQ
jgi:hypothetical protein